MQEIYKSIYIKSRTMVYRMSKNELFYYKVTLSLDGTWNQNEYTYSSNTEVNEGDVVLAPFGKTSKLGLVIGPIPLPSFNTKPFTQIKGINIPNEAMSLHTWMISNYPFSLGSHTQQILPSFIANLSDSISKDSKKDTGGRKLEVLSKSQLRAYEQIKGTSGSVVLHGVTGSGKTRIYAELAKDFAEANKNVLILYPEISLTSQLQNTLTEYFGADKLAVFHSKLTPRQRRQNWQKVLGAKKGLITIGPRSALFLPHSNLGAVIVDEAHDSAYKQDSGSRYNALIVAAALSKIHGARLILGSATPPIQETAHILSKGGSLVCMHELAVSNTDASRNYELVDMADKNNLFTSSNHLLSKPLVKSIGDSLKNNRQSLLFLNKRGTARLLYCENCGWHASCPRCEMPLTYHHDSFESRCHVCGYKDKAPHTCPKCSSSLLLKSPGTKSLEQDLIKIFPQAVIRRYDSDNLKKDSFTEQFRDIKNGKVDIIIGTQLVTKGIDLPKLETVGVLQADSSLGLPDFAAEERAFQVLSQVSGRANRGHVSGRVILQTYQKENPLFKIIEMQDWHKFYEEEINKRRKSNYPPFVYLLRVTSLKKSSNSAKNSLDKLLGNLKTTDNLTVLGPAPSFYEKPGGYYSWQIVLKSHSRKVLVEICKTIPKDLICDLDPVGLL